MTQTRTGRPGWAFWMALTQRRDDLRGVIRTMDFADLKQTRAAAELLTEEAANEIIRRGNR